MSHHHDDPICNDSSNEHFQNVLDRALVSPARRNVLRGSVGLSAAAALPLLQACGGDSDPISSVPALAKGLSFTPVGKSLADQVVVPAGYTVRVVHATGDPLDSSLLAYSNSGTETDDWARRIGDHHDGMDLFFIDSSGKYSEADTGRALLAVNHESSADAHFFHPAGQTSGGVAGKKFTQFGDWDAKDRPADGLEVRKEINHHGVSIVELSKSGSTWSYKKDSAYNRRITPNTVVNITGPAAHLANIKSLMVTAFDTSGATARGTLNNCGHGKTPWGTYLACEENWAVYFQMPAGTPAPDAKTVASRARYGVARAALSPTATAGASQGWHTVPGSNIYSRWNVAPTGASAAADYRNEPNTFGYNLEIDPAKPDSVPAKRVSMGRFAHEAAVCGVPVVGQPLAFYMGCDSRNEYIYKFVSTAVWSTADIGGGMAAGNKYLNEGKLYVAKFNADGSGTWLLLDISVPAIANFATYAFANQADVLVNTRLAADAVGATKMDRPEWGAVNTSTGEIYFALTNNDSRRTPATADGANPRSFNDPDGLKRTGNSYGHIIRFREQGSIPANAAATGFNWDIFVFGAEDNSAADVNLSGLTASNAFSSPDGLYYSPYSGIMWIQTDDGAFTDQSNCMLLAAVPGTVGDGKAITVKNSLTTSSGTTTGTTGTFIGAALGDAKLRRFLVAPKGAEVTGLAETPDGKVMFVNIQHPGEDTPKLGTASTFAFDSRWPGNATGTQKYGPLGRPRSATLVITRDDGGMIGV